MSIHLQNQINELKAQVAQLEGQVSALALKVWANSDAAQNLASALRGGAPHDKAAREILDSKRQRIADDTD